MEPMQKVLAASGTHRNAILVPVMAADCTKLPKPAGGTAKGIGPAWARVELVMTLFT